MRTNIDVDSKLLAEAIKVTGASTNQEVVELALASLIELKKQQHAKTLKG